MRDLCISYILVFITYTILGLIFYLAYPGWKNCITDEFIEVRLVKSYSCRIDSELNSLTFLTKFTEISPFSARKYFLEFRSTRMDSSCNEYTDVPENFDSLPLTVFYCPRSKFSYVLWQGLARVPSYFSQKCDHYSGRLSFSDFLRSCEFRIFLKNF